MKVIAVTVEKREESEKWKLYGNHMGKIHIKELYPGDVNSRTSVPKIVYIFGRVCATI